MLSSGRTSAPKWMPWLALCIITQLHLTRAQTAVSTLFIPDTNTVVSINLPPDSDDINFYVSSPDWYQYTAIGFGSSMTNALMLVMYASADRNSKANPFHTFTRHTLTQTITGVTVSPRIAT